MIDLAGCVVGVDLGDRTSLACVYAQGLIVEWIDIAMTPEGVRKASEGKGCARVAMEAGAQSGWVTRLLRTLGYEPVVANPRTLKAIGANTRKSDRNDALLLAKLVWSDASPLHPIHHDACSAHEAPRMERGYAIMRRCNVPSLSPTSLSGAQRKSLQSVCGCTWSWTRCATVD